MWTSRLARWASFLILVLLLVPAGGRAALLDPAFTETTFVSSPDLAVATGMAWAPDGSNRLFVTRKDGEIRIVRDGILLATPFATVTPLYNASECGLVGIAFDPNFLVNHYLYVFATVSGSEQQIIRYTADGDIGIAKTTVMPGLPTAGANHDGGAVGIGPDGKIYWSIGDNGSGLGVNDDLSLLAAKVGRANLDGSAVSDNPFFDGTGPNADHIWARGFRNPFTFTFQPATGLLWVNDVGNLYEQIFIVRRGDHAGWTNYENNQPQGFITPVIKYRTNGVDVRGILPAAMSGAVRVGGKATFVTDTIHGFRLGEKIFVSGVDDVSFNSNFFVAGIPSETSFSVEQAGPDSISGGGTATTTYLGGAVTGGAFSDATDFPAPYRGNFFFGDYNWSAVYRATIDPATNHVTSVDQWSTGVSQPVDVALGPDGALYYVGISTNGVIRVAYNATAQGLVVSPTNIWTAEGQPSVVMVRLAMMPADNVVVSAARAAGDTDLGVASGATLTFTGANWNAPQAVTIASGRDLDAIDDTATISITATGLPSQSVTVHVRDDNSLSVVVAPATIALDEGKTGTLTVSLSQQPSLDVNVTVARASGDADITVAAGATLIFTNSNWSVPQTVTMSAAEDADGVDDTAMISVASPGLVGRTVAVTVRDNDATAPEITSLPVLKAVVGAPYTYDVEATGLPPSQFSLDGTINEGMSIDPASGVITWTPLAAGSFMVTVRVANGVLPDATQTFGIEVSADMPPTCSLNRPLAGEVVSGPLADFSGDGVDDVQTVKAEFYVDDVLGYTDVAQSGNYNYGGVPRHWDTTTLANGTHTAKMVIFDTAGHTCSVEVTVVVANANAEGPDAGTTDGGEDAEAGRSTAGSGCGCRTGAAGGDRPGAIAMMLGLILVGRLRRRRPR